MNRSRLSRLLGFWALALCLQGVPALAEAGWIPLGTQWEQSYVTGINKSGQVVINSHNALGGCDFEHAFLYSNGKMTDLGNLGQGGADITHAYGINNSARIVGESQAGYWDNLGHYWTCNMHAFLYNGVKITDLGTLSGSAWDKSCATAINDKGQVAGYSSGYEGGAFDGFHAFLYSNGQMTDLGSMGKEAAYAYGINNSGQVVGYLAWPEGYATYNHAFFYNGSQMIDIHPQLPNSDGSTSHAYGINDSGQVVGDYYTTDGYFHVFLYANGVWQDLGTLDGRDTYAYAINNRGQIVGQGYSGKGRYYYDWQAFRYSVGQMVELPPFDVSSSALAINDLGQIAGEGRQVAALYNPASPVAFLNLLLQ